MFILCFICFGNFSNLKNGDSKEVVVFLQKMCRMRSRWEFRENKLLGNLRLELKSDAGFSTRAQGKR